MTAWLTSPSACNSLTDCDKLARARLHFVKQPGVLDCDHRLICEGGQQLDLFLGERPHGQAREAEHADREGSFA